MNDWHEGMDTAPRDREIVAWNDWAGEYCTQYQDGEWPLRGPQGDRFWQGGVWYPVPSRWRESTAHAPMTGFISTLTPDQREAALAGFDGDDTLGEVK